MTHPEVSSLLTLLRFTNVKGEEIIKKIQQVKQLIPNTEFKLIINGDIPIKLASFTYNLVKKHNCWSLRSQIEYEIFVKGNTRFNMVYQFVKSF